MTHIQIMLFTAGFLALLGQGNQSDSVFQHALGSKETILTKINSSDSSQYNAIETTATQTTDSIALDSTLHQIPDTVRFRTLKQNAFEVGEYLVFEIVYGIVKAGTAIMSIPDTQRVHGRPCYRIVTKAKSNDFFDTFFKVRDWVESHMDMEGLFTWYFEKHLREGKYKRDRYEVFDQIHHRVFIKKDTISVPAYIQDILTSFYYARTMPLKIGQSFDIDNFSDGKIYPLKVMVLKKEKIKVPAGTFKCVVVEPVLKGEGLFSQKGRLQIWMTDDKRHIPVLMKSKVLVGSIDVQLKAIHHKK